MASGTGGSAMAVAAHLNGLAARTSDVHLPGGVLRIEWTTETLFVTGPAVEVGKGVLDDAWIATATRGARTSA
jgi:diaminopimelate epimerase